MSLLSKVKFYLGLEVIVKYGDKFVITKRECFIRVCLDRKSEFWWTQGSWNRSCTLNTREEAELRIRTMLPAEPKRLRLAI